MTTIEWFENKLFLLRRTAVDLTYPSDDLNGNIKAAAIANDKADCLSEILHEYSLHVADHKIHTKISDFIIIPEVEK